MTLFQRQIRTLYLMLPVLLICTASWAQATEATPEASDNRDTSMKWTAEIGFEHSDNVFHLSESQQTAMEAKETADIDSHRYENMESISDTILSPGIGFKYKSDSPLGGKLKAEARATYHFYLENPDKIFPEAKITIGNSIGKNGDLSLETDCLFDYFKKNYLSAVDDENENGNITREERTYSAARYHEYESILSYGHELFNRKKEFLSELDVRPFLGYGRRAYSSPFTNRDRNIAICGIGFDFEFFSRLEMDVTYRYENVSAPGENELILFDETVADTDENGDGEIRQNAPLLTRIDRSADRYTIEISPSLKLSKDLLLFAGYRKRTTEYGSNNSLDIDHYRQTAYREKINFGLRYDFLKSWRAEAEYSQTDEKDEDDDYTEDVFCFSIKYDLF